MAAGGKDQFHSQCLESLCVQALRQHVFFHRSLCEKEPGSFAHDALAHGAFHTLLAIGQCGTNSKLFVDIIAVIVDVAVVHARRIFIIVAGRAQPPYNPVPAVWNDNERADCLFVSVPRESLLAFRYNHFLPVTTPVP